VNLGLVLPMFSGDPQKVLHAAREAEELGFHGVFAFDHFFPPGAPRDRSALEAFTTLAAVAAVTERVTLGTLVVRASVRPLGLLAKQASWLDAMSGGRFVLGIGTGDPIDRPEHEAYGIPELDKAERREHLEEALVALRALFEGGSYPGGRMVPALRGPLIPAARVPMWVGAQADPVVRIAGRLADGWNGWGLDPDPFRRKVEVLREAADGRDVVPTWAGIVLAGADRAETDELVRRRRERGLDDEAWTGSADELSDHLASLASAGAGWAILVLAGPADRRALLAERVLPRLPADSNGVR
jgi:alkanesulfonate monooxygenase SsuD/methylene tetrahydromethanopterin reductase-like flavin-dependent oxidoreductase (luciferase family)